ncbi:MAG: rhomboid family intramembrane serine protease [Nitrospirota bacterium]|nr:MAG: rhomboid family intramembrane serine protease [Nitrospirota bacterium]
MQYGRQWGFQLRITPVVKYLLIVNISLYVLINLLLDPRDIFPVIGLIATEFWSGAVWQVATYMFLHADFFHILINMLILWMFGTPLESTWGSRQFIKYYIICGLGAGLLHVLLLSGSPIPAVGASGAIYGLLLAFGILFPNQLIYIWGIIPVKAKYFVIGIGALELLASVGSSQSGIAHFVHLGGMLFGLVYLKSDGWRRSYSYWRSRKKHRKHLTIVRSRTEEKQNIQLKIDEILDKVNKHGIGSLSSEERKQFEDFSRKIHDLDTNA